jgi:hypothetical protein
MLQPGFLCKFTKRYRLQLSQFVDIYYPINESVTLEPDDLFLVISKTIAQDLVEKVLVITSRNNIGWIDLLEDEYEILVHNE